MKIIDLQQLKGFEVRYFFREINLFLPIQLLFMCRRLFLFAIFFACCIHTPVIAQTDTSQSPGEKGNVFVRLNRKIIRRIIREPKPFCDTNYVRTFSKVFTIGLPVSSKNLRVIFTDKASGNTLQYYPSAVYSPGVFINTSLFGFSITPSFLGIHPGSSKTGRSDFNDYQFHIYAKRFVYDISLQIYSGFYLNNTRSYKAYDHLDGYYKRSDLGAISGNFNIYYVFNNKKFSFRAPFSFTQSQIKSAGSFLIGTYLSNFGFTALSSVISNELKESFKAFPSMKSGNSFSTGISLGYAYTFVHKRFYVSSALVPGLGVNHIDLERGDLTTFSGGQDVSAKLKFTFGIGYTSPKWFFGCMFMSDNYYSASKTTPIQINYQVNRLRYFIGRRLNARKLEKRMLRRFDL